MLNLKTLYLRNLILDLYQKKMVVISVMLVCACLFGALGLKLNNRNVVFSKAEQEEITNFEDRLAEYDEMLADVDKSIALTTQQIDAIQQYIDSSIYMKLDATDIQVANIQYAITNANNTGNILNALILYINDGGLREDLLGEYSELEIEAWREIISCSMQANNLNISIFHYDLELAKEIREIVKTRLEIQIPEISEVHGPFEMNETNESCYAKVDVTIASAQNTHLTSLKNLLTNKADLENKYISYKNAKDNYLKNNTPEALLNSEKDRSNSPILFAMAGAISGFIIVCVIYFLRYILDNRLRTQADLKGSSICVVGGYNLKEGFDKSIDQHFLDLQLCLQEGNRIYLNALVDDSMTRKVVEEYQKYANSNNIHVEVGFQAEKNISELKKMMQVGTCVLLVEAGKTTYAQLEEQLYVCNKYHIDLLGCIVLE